MYDDIYDIEQYKNDILTLLHSPCISSHFIDYISINMAMECDADDILYLLEYWNAFLYDMTAHTDPSQRKYFKLRPMVQDSLFTFQATQSNISSI